MALTTTGAAILRNVDASIINTASPTTLIEECVLSPPERYEYNSRPPLMNKSNLRPQGTPLPTKRPHNRSTTITTITTISTNTGTSTTTITDCLPFKRPKLTVTSPSASLILQKQPHTPMAASLSASTIITASAAIIITSALDISTRVSLLFPTLSKEIGQKVGRMYWIHPRSFAYMY
jgi:hypothetical protein